MVKRLWRNEGVEKRGRPNEYRDSLNRAVTFKTETLGPCKILAHIPLKKATSGAHLHASIVGKFPRPLSRSRNHLLEPQASLRRVSPAE